MKYGVLSDVHGNLEAFETALKRLQALGAQQYIFCGDLIGYGPDPEECVRLYGQLADKGIVKGVQGNHDAVFARPELREYFNFDALRALEWSVQHLSRASMQRVSFLPETVHGPDFTAVHGTPADPIKEYFAGCSQFRTNYQAWRGRILFVGHTHLPFYMEGDENACHVTVVKQETQVSLSKQLRYVINPGSVGKPRDNDVRASFGLWDDKADTFCFFRQEYDYAKTQEKMRAAGLPGFLIDSLALGM